MSFEPPVFNNHIYTRIKEQVIFENEISRVRKDLESYLFTLFASSAFSKDDRKEKIENVLDDLDLNSYSSLSRIKEIAFLVSITENIGIKIDKSIHDTLETLLINLKKSSNYPAATKSIICWSLNNIERYSNVLQKIQSDLEDKAFRAFSKFQYLDGIEISFGTVGDSSIKKILENPKQFTSEAKKWPRDKIAKSIIRLSKSHSFDVSELIRFLEGRVDQELSSWIEPDVWLAVIESEKIINSNIPQDDINEVLENLNNVNSSWSKLVKTINEEGVHLKLDNVIKSPAFSPVEDTFSLIALHQNDRAQTVQLSKLEYDVLNSFKNKVGLIPFEKYGLIGYSLTVSFLSILIGFLFHQIFFSEEGIKAFVEPIKLLFNGELGSLLAKTNLILLLFGYSLYWLYNLIKAPIKKSDFDLNTFLMSIPLVSLILKEFIND